ncbi:SDR family oxidoreductase [Tetragenococcus koreensis]|nr:SDR family oxidoreductase [Tetragenococcus koreensis]MCF1617336.1 SDR family oxidoreductase [Tetragenococcus koreensis]
MTYFITGATGNIGSYIVQQLVDRGEKYGLCHVRQKM